MKFARMLILALGLVTLATASSFASVIIMNSASPTVMNQDAQTGLIGNITFTPMQAGTITAGEVVTVTLPNTAPGNIPISYLTDISVSMTGTKTSAFKDNFGNISTLGLTTTAGWVNATGGPYSAYGTTLSTSSAGTSPATSGASVKVDQYAITITFNQAVSFATNDYIQINGVRVDPTAISSGSGAGVTVNFSSAQGQAVLSNPTLAVASFVASNNIMSATLSGTLNFNTDGTINNGQNLVTVTLKELYPNAFETKSSVSGTSTRIKLTYNTNGLPLVVVPNGVTLASPDGATFTIYPTVSTYVGAQTNLTNGTIAIGIVSQNSAVNESCQIGLTFGVTSGLLPNNPPAITVTAQLDPPAMAADGTTPLTLPYNNATGKPTGYAQLNQLKYKVPASPLSKTIPVVLAPSFSNLLSPFNMVIYYTSGDLAGKTMYDTGIAVSNLTGSMSTYGISTPGTLEVSFYPSDGSGVFTLKSQDMSSALKASSGLNSNGELRSRGTFVATLSSLLKATGSFSDTQNFEGFVRIHCNFAASTGFSYIADGAFSQFAVGFVMTSDMPTNISGNTMVPPIF